MIQIRNFIIFYKPQVPRWKIGRSGVGWYIITTRFVILIRIRDLCYCYKYKIEDIVSKLIKLI